VWKRTEYRVKEGRYIGQSRGEKEAKRSGIEKNRCSTKTRKFEETARRDCNSKRLRIHVSHLAAPNLPQQHNMVIERSITGE
jgi:hypothetical protein